MPRIRCHYDDCIFLEEKYCGAAAIELDPDTGCLTYSQIEESESADVEEWDDELLDEEEEEDLYEDDEEEDDWDEEEDEEYR